MRTKPTSTANPGRRFSSEGPCWTCRTSYRGAARDQKAEQPPSRRAATPAREAVLDDFEQRAQAALTRIPRAHREAEAETARPGLRKRLEESLGLRRLPWPPDLRATVTGMIPRDGCRIEKIVFQTFPGAWVPAHLYLPDGPDPPAPAVLYSNGHWWKEGKAHPDAQAFCINTQL